jgi:hypothetical protein
MCISVFHCVPTINNIMNIYCRTGSKRDHDGWIKVVEGTWNGGVNFHRKPIPYLVSTGPENQERLAGLKLITRRLVGGWLLMHNEGWG